MKKAKKNIQPVEKAEPKKHPKKMSKTVQEFIGTVFEGITDEGVVAVGNGQYSKLYQLIDCNFSTEPENRQIELMERFSALINSFPEYITMSVAIINERQTKKALAENYHLPIRDDEYGSLVIDYNKMIDEKIKNSDADVRKQKYILLTYHAPQSKSKPKKGEMSELNRAEKELLTAEKALLEGASNINAAREGVIPVRGYERIALMYKILNGIDNNKISFDDEYGRYFRTVSAKNGVNHLIEPKEIKKQGTTLHNMIAPPCVSVDGQEIMLSEDRFCKSFAFQNLPPTLNTAFLTKITNFSHEMVTVVQFKPCPKKKATTLVKMTVTSTKADVIKAMKNAASSGYSTDLIDENIVDAKDAAVKLRDDVMNKNKKLFFATITCTFFGESKEEVQTIAKQFTSESSQFGVNPSYLLFQQKDALLSSMLCGDSRVKIDRMLTSDDVQALMPFDIQELNEKNGHYYGTNEKSNNLITHDRKRSPLPNGLIFGRSGSGKSFFTKGEIMPNFLDGNDSVIILDPENEYHVLADKFGGLTINLSLKSEWHINPCDMNMEWDDEEASPLAEKCDYMVSLVEAIYGNGRDCNIYEVNAIHNAATRMYEPYIAEMTRRHNEGCADGEDAYFDAELCPTLKDFYNELLRQGKAESQKVAAAVEQYCIGNYSIFAHHTNVPRDSRFVVYNLLSLPSKTMEMAMKVCLADIWNRIVKNRNDNEKYHLGRSVWVYLDEFHHFFQTKASAETIKAYWKRVRKYGGVMTGITQDASDLLRSEDGQAMYNNTGFYVFMNQSDLSRSQIQSLHHVSDNMIEYLNNKGVGKGLIYNATVMIPFNYEIPKTSEMYAVMSTNPHDKVAKKKEKEQIDREFMAMEAERKPQEAVKPTEVADDDDDDFTL